MTDDRIARIEEAVGFAEHKADQLSDEVARAFEEIARLRKQVEALTRRIADVEEGGIDEDADDPA